MFRISFVIVTVMACGGDPVRHLPDGPGAPDTGGGACLTDGATCESGVCCGGACVVGGSCCAAADCPSASYVCSDHQCVDVAGTLTGLVWQLPCGGDLTSVVCATTPTTNSSSTLGGVTGITYDVTLRFRGVIEQKTYTGGCADGPWLTAGSSNGDNYNIYQLTISSPPQTYFLNTGVSNLNNCFAIDYMQTIRVDTGATVTLHADSIDGQEIKNLDLGGMPITVAGTSVTQPYNGQFIQMDVISVAPDPVATDATIGAGSASFALSFNGAQVATVGANASLEPADVSVEAWFQFAGTANYDSIVMKPYQAGSADSYEIWYEASGLHSATLAASTAGAASQPWTPVNGEWHHAAMTYDHVAQRTTQYVDGLPTACVTNPAPTYDTHALLIGGDFDSGVANGFWIGALDEVRVFSVARSSADVWADMHTHSLGPTVGLVGEWTFDEGTGQKVGDSSGAANGATLGSTNAVETSDPMWISSTVPH